MALSNLRFLNLTCLSYAHNIASIIAKAQITNGGPVILYQPENEYSVAYDLPEFPDPVYFGAVEQQARDAGIVVPFISNDAAAFGYFTPGSPAGVDIYGHDSYPLGFDCANPTTWPNGSLPTNFADLHAEQSPSTPYSIVEFQGGSFDPWGGLGFAQCAELLNSEFQRVFYKNDWSFGIKILNFYMTFGGTNWGNIGHPGGYTSYDYGAVITEDRLVSREKYSEAKLEANFLQASPAWLTALPQNNSHANGSYSNNPAIAVTALFGNTTRFFVVRHSIYNSLESTQYKLSLPTSQGNITIPQINGSLTLNGRDSKAVVTDYDVGGFNLLYSSAEIFTWKTYGSKTVLVVYGGPDEQHELAFSNTASAKIIEGSGVTVTYKNGNAILNFATSTERRIAQLPNNLYVYILDRYSAYNYWTIDLPSNTQTGNFTNPAVDKSAAIVKAGYLIRTIEASGSTLAITGDVNATTPIEVIGGAPSSLKTLTFNGKALNFTQSSSGVVTANVEYIVPEFVIPDLSTIGWKTIDSLPEISAGYDDTLWTDASLTYTNNTIRNLTTPTSLYSSDYGYHYGNLIYRGHFVASGNESSIYIQSEGGYAFGVSAWLNSTFIGSFLGYDAASLANTTFTFPTALTPDASYIVTVLIDNMGLDEDYTPGEDDHFLPDVEILKKPRGILDFSLASRPQSAVSWKLTGNLGGEDYQDHTRGPLNEGGLYAERQGYHLPGAPTSDWATSALGPMSGIGSPGVQFYSTTFDLDIPVGYDIPIAVSFSNTTTTAAVTPTSSYSSTTAIVSQISDGQIQAPATTTNATTAATAYRCQIYVNGYQFGKYVHNVGPQDVFPVPQGIWDYGGSNTLAVSLWALEEGGAAIEGLSLVVGPVIQSGYGEVVNSPMTGWVQRAGAY